MERYISAPITKEDASSLRAGDYVYITGTIYTARDAAHKRMEETLEKNESIPIDIKNQVIYYMGPSPARDCRSDWIRRTNYGKSYGQVHSQASRSRIICNDREGKKK